MTSTAAKDARLVARVPSELQELIRQAADLSGATLSQFVVEAVTAKARNVMAEMQELRSIRLSLQGAQDIFDALENPSNANPALAQAAKAYAEGRFLDGSTIKRRPHPPR